jgi:hypothetical protein
VLKHTLRSSIRYQLRRPAHPRPKQPPRQIRIHGNRPRGPPQVPSWELSDAGPQCTRIGHHRPASRNPSPNRSCGRQVSPDLNTSLGKY